MTDSLNIELDRAIAFTTAGGDAVPAHGVALVLTGDGKQVPPGARLQFRVTYAVYNRILAGSLFGLTPEARGEPMTPFTADKDLDIEVQLRPAVAADLIARGGGAETLIGSLIEPIAGFELLARDESWQARSVQQDLDGIKSGYSTTPGGTEMIDTLRRAAGRAGSELEDLGEGLYRMQAGSERGTWTMLVTIVEDTRLCAVYSVLPDPVPLERRPEVALYLVDRNYYLTVGAFEMDVEDGEVRLRTSIDVSGTSFDEALVANMVGANLTLFDRHLETLRALAAGTITLGAARAQTD